MKYRAWASLPLLILGGVHLLGGGIELGSYYGYFAGCFALGALIALLLVRLRKREVLGYVFLAYLSAKLIGFFIFFQSFWDGEMVPLLDSKLAVLIPFALFQILEVLWLSYPLKSEHFRS